MKLLKILMLEDNLSDAGLIKRILEKSNIQFETIIVDTKEEFIKGLKEFTPDAIFSDHTLPQFNSLEAFETLKRTELNIPFILITGSDSEEFAIKCLREGIDDYILKDNLYRLPVALENALNKRKLEAQKHELEAEQIKYIEKLKTKNNELIKLSYELDRFVYSASHELKAPLASVLGLVSLIESELSGNNFEVIAQYLQLIEESVDKLIRTIEEIIHYAINNHTAVQKEKIHPQQLIDSIWTRLKYTRNPNKVIPKIHINEQAEWYSDKNRLMIILENIISNAIQFRDEKKSNQLVLIDILIFPEKVRIEIKDNGIGIAQKYKSKIFNMFYKATSDGQGSGLGLYLVKEAIEKLNGTIDVESIEDKETTFCIELPNLLNAEALSKTW